MEKNKIFFLKKYFDKYLSLINEINIDQIKTLSDNLLKIKKKK